MGLPFQPGLPERKTERKSTESQSRETRDQIPNNRQPSISKFQNKTSPVIRFHFDNLVRNLETFFFVIPAKAGI